MAGCSASLSFLPSLSCDSRMNSETFVSVYGKNQPITSKILRQATNKSIYGIHGVRTSSALRIVPELLWRSSSFVHVKQSSRNFLAQNRQNKKTERGISRASLDDHGPKVAEKESKTNEKKGTTAEGGNGGVSREHDSELLTRVKDTVKDSVDSVKGSVGALTEAVTEAVVEEAAIVVDAVEKGVEVAANTVSSVGELPIDVEQLDSAERQRALATVGFWVGRFPSS